MEAKRLRPHLMCFCGDAIVHVAGSAPERVSRNGHSRFRANSTRLSTSAPSEFTFDVNLE